MQNKDLSFLIVEELFTKLDNIASDVKEIKEELKSTKESLHLEVSNIKVQQEKCNSYWTVVGRTLSFGSLGGVAGSLIAFFFPKGH